MNAVSLPEVRTDKVTVVTTVLQPARNFGGVEVGIYKKITQSYFRVWKT